MDNRGVGESTAGSWGRYTTKGMAMDVAHVLKEVGWTGDRTIHLAGISMGGMVSKTNLSLSCV
jgi:pimeloyl-ACP methyl ester carboxylesterase